jgi:CHAD domain-containing protein
MPEREVKLGAPPGFRLPPLEDLPGTRAQDGGVERLRATYYDTADLRLARWGCSLRYRPPEGWTVKLAMESRGPLLVRDERYFAGDARRPPREALDLLTAYLRSDSVGVVARLRTVRRSIELLPAPFETAEGQLEFPSGPSHDGPADGSLDDLTPLAVVTDDEVSVMDGSRLAARFREVEVEVADGASDELVETLVDRLRGAGAGAPDPTPKYVRAVGPRALEPPEVWVLEVGANAPASDVVRRALATSVVRLLRSDGGVRLGEDPEDVHQARVATRRLRSDLRTFAPLLDPEWGAQLRDELRWIADELGTVRDNDVMMQRLRSGVAALPESDRPPAERLLGSLEDAQAAARARLLQSLRDDRYVALLERLVRAAQAPALLPEAGGPAGDLLPPLVRRPWKRLRAVARTLGEDPSDEELHQLRIRAKRCRYAAEAVAPVMGKEATAFAEALAELQDVLGDHQDAAQAQAWLRDASRRASGRSAFVAGELTGAERASAAQTRAAWPRAWKSASRKGLRSWF